MDARQAVPFRSPGSMAVHIAVPNAGMPRGTVQANVRSLPACKETSECRASIRTKNRQPISHICSHQCCGWALSQCIWCLQHMSRQGGHLRQGMFALPDQARCAAWACGRE